jgi:2-oxo-4-hydroxy-4-carboxy-5-ureidoimidazoline decarboxylase
MTLDQINRLDMDDFVTLLGGIFEHSPWIAERAYAKRPFASLDALHEAMVAAMYAAEAHEQLQLLCAHPELAGRAAERGQLTVSSRREQAGAGLDQYTASELQNIRQLNEQYRAKFGFPFIIAVKGMTRDQILGELTRRVLRGNVVERNEALAQVARIAWNRLSAAVTASA